MIETLQTLPSPKACTKARNLNAQKEKWRVVAWSAERAASASCAIAARRALSPV